MSHQEVLTCIWAATGVWAAAERIGTALAGAVRHRSRSDTVL